MQRVERDDGARGKAEFGQQGLRCRDLIGSLGDVDGGEHQRGVCGERAQHLDGGAVVEFVETAAQRLAIQCNAALSGCGARRLQQGGMAAEGRFHPGRVEPLEDVADGSVRRRAAPVQAEGRVQPAAMDVDEGDDAAIRVAAGYDGKDGEQQHMEQLVELPLRPARYQERPPAHPTTAKTQPRHSPTQLPPQRSDIGRLECPPCDQMPHFTPYVWQSGPSAAHPAALNSPDARGDQVIAGLNGPSTFESEDKITKILLRPMLIVVRVNLSVG